MPPDLNTRTSALAALTTVADDDLVPVVDISDATMAATGTNKKVTKADLSESMSLTGTAGHKLVDVDPADPRLPDEVIAATMPYEDAELYLIGVGADKALALQAAMTAAAASGRTLLLRPGSYSCQSALTIPSGLKMVAYGATLLNDRTGVNDRLLSAVSVSDIVIEGLTLDGKKASFASATEQRHGLYLSNVANVQLVRVTSHDNKGDGLYIGDSTNGLSTGVRDFGGVYRDNHRNNCSITRLIDGKFFGTSFINALGTAPQVGCDIEPNTDTDEIDDIQFYGCKFNGNAGKGFWFIRRSAPSVTQGNIGLYGCTADDNATDGFRLNTAFDARIEGGGAHRNGESGVYILGAGRNLRVNTDSSENGHYGLLHATGAIDGLKVGGTYWHNGSVASNTYPGIYLAATSGTTLATILPGTLSGGPSSGARQQYGLRVQSAYTVRHLGGHYPNNVTAPTLFHASAVVEGYTTAGFRVGAELEVDGALNHDGTTVGFYGATPVTKAADPGTAAGTDATVINAIVTALRNLGLVT